MIDFSSKTYAAILAAMLADVPDSYDKRDTSPIQTALGPAAYQLEGMYMILDQMQNQAFIETAVGSDLDLIAALGGISRHAATPAVRLGTFDVDVPLGSRFSTINGADSIDFVVTSATGNTLQKWLTAETPGTIGNQYTGAILPITTIPGLTSAVISTIIVDGSDEETDDELRSRLVLALTDKPFAGNISSYRNMLLELEIDGTPIRLGGVQVYPTPGGQGGKVTCSVVGSDYLPIEGTLVPVIQNAVDPTVNSAAGLGLAPIGAQVTITTPTTVTVNITANVAHTAGTTIDAIQTQAAEAIEDYLAEIRSEWGVSEDGLTYISKVYISRITAAILSVTGVTNVTTVKINNSASDLALTETYSSQQVPVLGTVTLTEV